MTDIGKPSAKQASGRTPQWVRDLPEGIVKWTWTLQSKRYFGLFKESADSFCDFTIPACSPCIGMFLKRFGAWERTPGYSLEAIERTAKFVQSCQDPKTGLFWDPEMDPHYTERSNPRAYGNFLETITKYAIPLLGDLGGYKPLHPYHITGGTGLPDPNEYLEYLRTGNWKEGPWGIGSHAGRRTRELFFLINDGHTEYIPAVCAGIELMLSHQNPQTGMWGASSIRIEQQIGGALKVLCQLQFAMGFGAPNLDRLADSIITHAADGSFYANTDNLLIPRNAAEMAMVCLANSDYRRDELVATLEHFGERLRLFQREDGGFSSTLAGTGKLQWCGAEVANESPTPRSNINGTQSTAWALGLLGDALGWDDTPFPSPYAGWRDKVAALKCRIILTPAGKIEIVPKEKA